jgi:hypothetical protein
MVIKDSGSRTEFPSGAKRDLHTGKGRMDLLPWAAIMEVSKHCENGSQKYGEHNVDKGIPTHSLCDSAARHLAKYLDGWTDEPHLLAAAWNLLWAIQMELKHPECVDTPWYTKAVVYKECPVCGEVLPKEAKWCEYCLVTFKEPEHDSDEFLAELETD